MLQLAHTGTPSSSSSSEEKSFLPQLDLLSLLRICYRAWPTIAAAVGVTLALGVVYLLTATPKYTASALIMVDGRKGPSAAARQQEPTSERLPDPGLVDSQVEILKSDTVALAAVRKLDLINDPDFLGRPGFNPIAWVRSLLPGSDDPPPTDAQRQQAAAEVLANSIKTKRLSTTYVLQVDYTGLKPARTAEITNAVLDAYIDSELEARLDATRRATRWLQDRLIDLKQQVATAEGAVQKYKADNNIVDTTRGLMSEQQLSDVNSQLIAAHASTAEAKARLDRVLEVSKGDITNATVADALKSEIVTRLRAQYLDLANRANELATRYGEEHGAVQNLRNQMAGIGQSAREELRRIAESTRSDYEIAQAREDSIRKSLANLVSQASTTNQAQIKLRELESSAQALRSLYDAMLQKSEETATEQTFPITNARIITPASTPKGASSPKVLLVFAGAVFLGLLGGFGVALVRELFGNTFRTSDDVKSFAGLECLGTLPNLARGLRRAPRQAAVDPTILGSTTPIARQAVIAPFSRFTETLRNVKVTIDGARGSTSSITGIVSSLPHEGKTTFSANLALLTAQMGHRTILIDGDMHRGSLTKTLRPEAKAGMVEVLTGRCSAADVIHRDAITGLDFLPTLVGDRHTSVVSLLTSKNMNDLLTILRGKYDYIYIDLPPLVPVVDAKASCHLFDNFVFVIEWARTSRDAVRDAILSAEQVRQRTLGVVLNKADPSQLKRLESYRGPAYGSYYVEADAA